MWRRRPRRLIMFPQTHTSVLPKSMSSDSAVLQGSQSSPTDRPRYITTSVAIACIQYCVRWCGLTSTIQHVKFLCSNLLRTMLWRLFFSSTLFFSLTILFYRILRTLAMPMSVCTASMASPHARAIPARPPSSDVNKTTRFKTKAKTKTEEHKTETKTKTKTIGPITT